MCKIVKYIHWDGPRTLFCRYCWRDRYFSCWTAFPLLLHPFSSLISNCLALLFGRPRRLKQFWQTRNSRHGRALVSGRALQGPAPVQPLLPLILVNPEGNRAGQERESCFQYRGYSQTPQGNSVLRNSLSNLAVLTELLLTKLSKKTGLVPGLKILRKDICAHVGSVALSCPTLRSPMDCSSPGSSVHGVFQASTLERVAISYPRGSSWPRDWTTSLASPALAVDSLALAPPGKPKEWNLDVWGTSKGGIHQNSWVQQMREICWKTVSWVGFLNLQITNNRAFRNLKWKNFPGSPVVKTLPFYCRESRFDP